ncbi:hypothetical protein D3C86_687700 [compost metagenome]
MKTFVFFDLSLVGIKRYPLRLANALAQLEEGLNFVFLYDQPEGESEEAVRRLLPANAVLRRVGGTSHRHLRDLLATYRPDNVIVMAQRLPDSALVASAKVLGISTIMVQHGLYVPFMRREKRLFISQSRKTWRYVRYAKAIADARAANPLIYIRDYLRVFVKGRSIRETRIDRDFVNVDKVLVYGEHWKTYHEEVFGYRRDQQVVVGYPDLDDVAQVGAEPRLSEPCYIAQTLVEDGRLDRELMLRFVETLGSAMRNAGTTLRVKLHPRSDRSLYEALGDVAIFETTAFPHCKAYIGHYSSMLVKATFFSDKILLVDFPGHEVPDYIRRLSWATCSYREDMAPLVTEALDREVDEEKVARNVTAQAPYFAHAPEGAITSAAKAILTK